jgi:thiamine biosynthesis lipoprotein
MSKVLLDENKFAVRFADENTMLDLGAIGKGYALERAADFLREAGVEQALIHGGTSTVAAIGTPPDAEGWKISLEDPRNSPETEHDKRHSPLNLPPLAVVTLRDEALSVSAVHGKSFQAGGKVYGHVIDPRTGCPAQGALLSAVVLPSATETDALSTALLIGGAGGHRNIQQLRPGMRTFLVEQPSEDGRLQVESFGIDPRGGIESVPNGRVS